MILLKLASQKRPLKLANLTLASQIGKLHTVSLQSQAMKKTTPTGILLMSPGGRGSFFESEDEPFPLDQLSPGHEAMLENGARHRFVDIQDSDSIKGKKIEKEGKNDEREGQERSSSKGRRTSSKKVFSCSKSGRKMHGHQGILLMIKDASSEL